MHDRPEIEKLALELEQELTTRYGVMLGSCSGLISRDTPIGGKCIYRGVFRDRQTQISPHYRPASPIPFNRFASSTGSAGQAAWPVVPYFSPIRDSALSY